MGCDIHAEIEFRDGNDRYRSLTAGGLLLRRDRELFGALAGARGDPYRTPLFAPRGLPAQHSYCVDEMYFEQDGERRVIPCPDYHTASWLVASEIRAALTDWGRPLPECGADFRAVVAAMDELDSGLGSDASRLVFWFDN